MLPALEEPDPTPPDPSQRKAEFEIEKLEEEIRNLKLQMRNDRIRLWLDLIKAVALALAAVTTFFLLQKPDSIISRTASRETIDRERAKLLLDSLKDPDAQKRLDGLRIIRAAYGSDDAHWLDQMESSLQQLADFQSVLSTTSQLDELQNRRKELHRKLREEGSGTGSTKTPGTGPIYKALEAELRNIDAEINNVTVLLNQQQLLAQTRSGPIPTSPGPLGRAPLLGKPQQ